MIIQTEKGQSEATRENYVIDEHGVGDADLEFTFKVFVGRGRRLEQGGVLAALVVAPAADIITGGLSCPIPVQVIEVGEAADLLDTVTATLSGLPLHLSFILPGPFLI